jgi:hypothetical protein
MEKQEERERVRKMMITEEGEETIRYLIDKHITRGDEDTSII